MKLAFISDIHGNAIALESVLKDLKKRNVDQIFVLGDICYRGPEPKRALELVQSLNTEVIKGNADEWVVRGVEEGEVPNQALEMMNKERDWTLSQLNEENINYLQNLPQELNLEYGRIKIHAFHATPASLFDVVLPFEEDTVIEDKLMVNSDADIYVYGHIHKPYIRYINGKCVINTGSIGLPFDGLTQSSYLLLNIDEETVQSSIIRVFYDVGSAIAKFNQLDYPNKETMVSILENAKI
ncbi:metallophosphoesterase family protein [Jeotgalibacillus soli]|uniref:Phosphoesterase n=1 Tax=Jeotgalibacillus soli TaxID=889306 RepID=A0A0C2VY73_9BACL|nr:YfcE family phosphodiesterase [Jeotgalibacillus soli]KIL49371.1 phosphodiesterase [Jeotgalibacillus soli]